MKPNPPVVATSAPRIHGPVTETDPAGGGHSGSAQTLGRKAYAVPLSEQVQGRTNRPGSQLDTPLTNDDPERQSPRTTKEPRRSEQDRDSQSLHHVENGQRET